MRKYALLALGAVAVSAAVLAAAVAWAADGDRASSERTEENATGRATVDRRDLVEQETLDGTLGFDDARPLTAHRPGTLTRVAREGRVVRRGGMLYEVDGEPVYLLYGERPAWRTLRVGVPDGPDVRQLERNLVALGYDPGGDIEVDGHFDWATREAVERWERARGVRRDGVVELGEVVFLPGPRRVGAHSLALGSSVQPGSEVMETSSTRRVATVQLEASRQDLVREGDRVEVELPDGTTTAGTVVDVGDVAESSGDEGAAEDGGAGGGEGEAYVVVTITLARAPTNLVEAPVDVSVASEERRNALAVPVTALLALGRGGYAVEVVDARGHRLVPVEVGMIADGYAEISGKGIRAGTRVAVPR